MITLFVTLGLVLGLAQDRADTLGALQKAGQAFEQLENTLGKATVARLFLEGVTRSAEKRFQLFRERAKSLTSSEVLDLNVRVAEAIRTSGTPSSKRTLRNLARKGGDPRDQLFTLLESIRRENTQNSLEAWLARFEGRVSVAIRASMDELRHSRFHLEDPFVLTRGWYDFVNDTEGAWFFLGVALSTVMTPVALAGDLVLLPFQLLYWIGDLCVADAPGADQVEIEKLKAQNEKYLDAIRALQEELNGRRPPG